MECTIIIRETALVGTTANTFRLRLSCQRVSSPYDQLIRPIVICHVGCRSENDHRNIALITTCETDI